MGDINSQIRLLSTLEAYELAERAAQMFPVLQAQQAKADALHDQLCRLAMACGFAPGREHRHLTTVEWARQRAATIRRVFPNHVAEANGRAA